MSVASMFRQPALGRLALACALALGAAPFCARAQSLQDLYDTARSYDASYLAARALAESAQYRAAQAHALRRPSVSANITTGRSSTETKTNDVTTTDLDGRSTSASLNASQSLFNRANDATIAQADQAVEAARADLEVAEQELIVRVAQTYFDVLAAQDALATAQASKKAISEQLASAKRNFEVGTATITDTREAQARYDLATAQEIAADNDLQTKRIALDQLVGRTGVAPRPLAPPVALPPVLPASVDAWVSQTETSPLVRKARIGFDRAQLETTKARAGHLPTVGVSASYSKNRGHQNGLSVPPGQIDASSDGSQTSLGLRVDIPLFAGFAVQNQVKEALLLEEQARNNLEAARRSVAQSTRQAYFSVQSLQAQVKALEAAEASSQVALEATRLGYKVGVRVNLDVLNAQTQLYSTQRDLARSRYDVLLTNLRLRQASGQLRPSDVAAVNSMLAR